MWQLRVAEIQQPNGQAKAVEVEMLYDNAGQIHAIVEFTKLFGGDTFVLSLLDGTQMKPHGYYVSLKEAKAAAETLAGR